MSRQKIRFSYAVLGPNPREAADKAGGGRETWHRLRVGSLQQFLDTFEKFVNLGATNILAIPLIADEESDEILSRGNP